MFPLLFLKSRNKFIVIFLCKQYFYCLNEIRKSSSQAEDLGSLRYFLGMEVVCSKRGIVVSQQKYILDLLEETGMSGCRPADTPIDPNGKLWEKGSVPVDVGRYQRLVVKLIYIKGSRYGFFSQVHTFYIFKTQNTPLLLINSKLHHLRKAVRSRELATRLLNSLFFKKN